MIKKLLVIVGFVVEMVGLGAAVQAADSTIVANTIIDTPTTNRRHLAGNVNSIQTYRSVKFRPNFSFNGVGLRWHGPKDAKLKFYIRTDQNRWWPVSMTDDSKNQVEPFVSEPLFISGQFVQYKVTGRDLTALQSVELIYFDSKAAPSQRQPQVDTSANDLKIISRAEWGADESAMTWQPQVATPQKIVIHHTAGGDGGSDPAATVRGIYYWQSTVLGWGDIGYNYLIDPAGTIYEGRSGGPGTIGAHAYNAERGVNYNVGSIGVAVLGCYEHSAGACPQVNDYTLVTQTALTQLIADQGIQFNFRPIGSSTFINQTTKNVITHRDIDLTYCPGNGIRDQLLDIRWQADVQYWSLLGTQDYQAMPVSTTLAAEYSLNQLPPEIALQYTNTGVYDWAANELAVKMHIVGTQQRQKVTVPTAVAINQTITVPLTWQLPLEPGTYQVVTKLVRRGKYVPGSHTHHTVTIVQ